VHSQGTIERTCDFVVSHRHGPGIEPASLPDLVGQSFPGGANQPDQEHKVMRARNLDSSRGNDCLERFLNRLLCVETNDIVGLVQISRERPRGCKIRRRLT
jgi:hypothetical protein